MLLALFLISRMIVALLIPGIGRYTQSYANYTTQRHLPIT